MANDMASKNGSKTDFCSFVIRSWTVMQIHEMYHDSSAQLACREHYDENGALQGLREEWHKMAN